MKNRQFILKAWFEAITIAINSGDIKEAKRISESATEYIDEHFLDDTYWPEYEGV